uniref:Formyl transferase N-terminal domain-containing protein n=1 Tax=Pseudictyota dubia TaxID=2749911 RepID=A0A7R9WMH3_9STRA|mmetsp:Transcript_9833/g.18676  ORF Transcript_9833/g.18676 Transcript_9833/m.18676 type:complete len:332 (+) Transcript_9833:212-1207(+)
MISSFRLSSVRLNGRLLSSGPLFLSRLLSTSTSVSPGLDPSENKAARLLVHGPDSKGIVASFSQILFDQGCGIIDSASEQSTDGKTKLFFQRIVFDYGSHDSPSFRKEIEYRVHDQCRAFGMESYLNWGDRRKRVAIMVSKYDHCLWELLLRHRAHELDCDIVAIISNHPDLQNVAETFSLPYHHFSINPENKPEQEEREMQLLTDTYKVDVVVLARYMQVLSDAFVGQWPNRIINIHHSFLPAFLGGKPYHKAHERGVKLIGATAHFTTVDLDEGPIIEQDIARVSHRDTVNDMIRKGRTLEKNVLVHALKAYLEDRIIVYKNKCIVFGE